MQLIISAVFREADRLEARKQDITRGNRKDYTAMNLMVDTFMARACIKAIVQHAMWRTPDEQRTAKQALKRLVEFSYEIDREPDQDDGTLHRSEKQEA
jgi:hypothetical protein